MTDKEPYEEISEALNTSFIDFEVKDEIKNEIVKNKKEIRLKHRSF